MNKSNLMNENEKLVSELREAVEQIKLRFGPPFVILSGINCLPFYQGKKSGQTTIVWQSTIFLGRSTIST